MTLGPERATLLERFLTIFNIPYYLGCFIVILIFGPIGALLSAYLQTKNIYEAYNKTVYLFFGVQLPHWQGVAGLSLLLVILFYFLYMIRYMRLKLVAAEQLLIPLFPEGEDTYHNVFGHVSLILPPIIIEIVIIAFFFLQAIPETPINFIVYCSAPAAIFYLIISFPVWFLIFSTFAWVYFSSIRGLHELGKKSLNLKPFYEDRMLGVRPIGSLSLSLAFTYFVGLGILTLLPIVIRPDPSPIEYIFLLLILTLLGVIFFFLPLNTIHNRMLDKKSTEQKALLEEFRGAVSNLSELNARKNSGSSILDLKEILISQTLVLTFGIKKEEVTSIPTWPFDTQILGRFTAMIFSIITTIIATIIIKRILNL